MAEISTYTLGKYLRSLVNIVVPEDTITGICMKRKLDPEVAFVEYELSDYELATADLYAWLATSPITSSKITDSDGDWSHSEGGVVMSATQLAYYRGLANAIYQKYGEELVSATSTQWGMSGYGFANVRNYGGRR